jgi:ADP-ribose pyrophosphatase YjhB (NUDIX family)
MEDLLLMKARIRGAAVIVHEQQIVLARHDDAERRLTWWSPPGGGVEGEESILVSAEREAREETSLRVIAERPIYAQELLDPRRKSRTLELFILCRLADGVVPTDLRADNEIAEARFFTAASAAHQLILPDVFRAVVWDDLAAGFPEFRYLGVAHLQDSPPYQPDAALYRKS